MSVIKIRGEINISKNLSIAGAASLFLANFAAGSGIATAGESGSNLQEQAQPGVDDVDGTYEVVGTAAYHFKAWGQSARAFFGYRHLHINYDDGSVALNLNVTGPLVGIGFDF